MAPKPRNALLAALLCLFGLAATGIVALASPLAQVRDSATLHGFTSLSVTRLGGLAGHVAHLVDPNRYVVVAIALALLALLRRRPRLALIVPLAMVAAAASTELLKPLVAQPRFSEWLGSGTHVDAASWPSGHSTAAMMIALCAVLVSPAALRPLTALLGTALAVGVSYSILVLGWHFPSDVLGGFLVAGTWTALAVSVLWWADARWPARAGRQAVARAGAALAPAAMLALTVGGAGAALALRGRLAATYAVGHASFVVGASAIALLAAVLASVLAYALSDRVPAATGAHSLARHPAQG